MGRLLQFLPSIDDLASEEEKAVFPIIWAEWSQKSRTIACWLQMYVSSLCFTLVWIDPNCPPRPHSSTFIVFAQHRSESLINGSNFEITISIPRFGTWHVRKDKIQMFQIHHRSAVSHCLSHQSSVQSFHMTGNHISTIIINPTVSSKSNPMGWNEVPPHHVINLHRQLTIMSSHLSYLQRQFYTHALPGIVYRHASSTRHYVHYTCSNHRCCLQLIDCQRVAVGIIHDHQGAFLAINHSLFTIINHY